MMMMVMVMMIMCHTDSYDPGSVVRDTPNDDDDDGDGDDDVSYGFRMTQDKLPQIIRMMLAVWMVMTIMEGPICEHVLQILDMTPPKPRF